MSIVKEIVGIHGGRIEIESEPGEGTRVTPWLARAARARLTLPGADRTMPGPAFSMVARAGSSATISREPRQARKGATVAVASGAGGVLARAASTPPQDAR